MIKLHQCQSIQTVYRLKHWPLVIISLTGLRLAISWSVAKEFFIENDSNDQIASMSVHSNSLETKTLTTGDHLIDRSTTGYQLVCREGFFF